MAYKVAVVGATGNVGREMFRPGGTPFPHQRGRGPGFHPLSGNRSVLGDGTLSRSRRWILLRFQGHRYLPDVGGRRHCKEYSPKIAARGCLVIDNSSAWQHGPRRAAGGA